MDNLSLVLEKDEPTVMTIAGESGSGKTTIAKLLLGFIPPSHGQILYDGKDINDLRGGAHMTFRREVQAVFQDPFAVFNPFYTVDHLLEVPIRRFKLARNRRETKTQMEEALTAVGLQPDEILGRSPTSSPAGSGSASTSPARWSCGRRSWSPTSPSPWSTPRCGRTSSRRCST